MKSLDEDSLQNVLYLAILNPRNIYLDYARLLRKHLNEFLNQYFNDLIKRLQHRLKEYNEDLYLLRNSSTFLKDILLNQ
jgi:hypothetical protein